MPPEAVAAFLAALLTDTVPLRRALCAGFSDVFDPPVPYDDDDKQRIAFARRACACCPALTECRAWVDGLPASRRPVGVVAGKLRRVIEPREDAVTA